MQWAGRVNTAPIEVGNGIARFAQDSWSDYRELPRDEAVERALPIPDTSTSGKMIWVLPNLSSFTHIYARINLFKDWRLAGVRLFHDEQLQFGDILLHNKALAEGLGFDGFRLPLKTSDFEFSEKANLIFLKSHESLGIQIADILTGYMARYVQDAVWSGKLMRQDKTEIFGRLVTMGIPASSTGVSIVAPDSLVRFLGIPPRQITDQVKLN